jgi:hypothetical protein
MKINSLIYCLIIPSIILANNLENKLIMHPKINETEVLQNMREIKPKKDFSKLDKRYDFSEEALLKFNSWIDSTLKDSKNNDKNAIIVDKSEYKLYLINKGEIIKEYFIELGFNPFQDKLKKGDGCTPEGIYEIAEKKEWSLYHKALLLNYPNKKDRTEGKTGSLIELHGGGSGKKGNKEGNNWTLGCIAVSNLDIDEIYKIIQKKEWITVVKYNNILN